MSFNTNETFNGTNGTLWINNTPCASVQSFSFKQTNVYEDIKKSGSLSKSRRLVGVEYAGTISKYKVDNTFISLMKEYKNGDEPEIKLVGKITNKTTGITERVEITGVTLGELDILNFEQQKVVTEEIPFEAEDWNPIDL